jgi:hypothetical protein
MDYAGQIYDQYRKRGGIGDVVDFEVKPWLMKEYGLTEPQARRLRDEAMADLKARGMIERVNVRGRYIRILG